jgi:hypothetical protein
VTICSNIDLLILCSRKRLFLELIFEVDRRDRETRRVYKRLADSIGHSRGSKGPILLASEIKTRRGFLRKKFEEFLCWIQVQRASLAEVS